MPVPATWRAASEFDAALGEPDFFVELLDSLSDAVYLVDRDRTIRFWNRACEQITGYRAVEVVGHHCFEGILRHVDEHGRRLCFGPCPLALTIKDGTPRENRIWLHHKDGHRVEVQVGVRPVRDGRGQIIGAIETFTDESAVAATHARLAELEQLAMVDALTGVPNRRFLEMTLSSRLAELRRYAVPFVVAFADIDHFKRVNDDNGHDVGDEVLRMVAKTLSGNVRSSDTLARFGGEEFVLVLNHMRVRARRSGCLSASTCWSQRVRSKLMARISA
jgi:diguanylate cyclase (GGDEF)-like protein/PAS domain S-box-containing protein